MTLAEQLRAEGREEVMQHQRMLLNRLLTRRFGNLTPQGLLKLEQADADTLLIWGDKLLDANSIEEVFAE